MIPEKPVLLTEPFCWHDRTASFDDQAGGAGLDLAAHRCRAVADPVAAESASFTIARYRGQKVGEPIWQKAAAWILNFGGISSEQSGTDGADWRGSLSSASSTMDETARREGARGVSIFRACGRAL